MAFVGDVFLPLQTRPYFLSFFFLTYLVGFVASPFRGPFRALYYNQAVLVIKSSVGDLPDPTRQTCMQDPIAQCIYTGETIYDRDSP